MVTLRKFQPASAVLRQIFARLAWKDGILLIPLAALLASSARITRGVSCGHDFDFHLVSWLEVQRSWGQGVFYPHWAQTPNWGAGEPRFIFYPPMTWLLGGLISCLSHWTWHPMALTFLFLTAAGLFTRALARQFLPAPNATLAGIIATATPYALFTAYERTAYSELAAASFIPLLLLYAWRTSNAVCPTPTPKALNLNPEPDSLTGRSPITIATDSQKASMSNPVSPKSLLHALDGSATPLALVLALIWLTNAPSGVMASYLLAFAALAAAILLRAWWPILRALTAAALALALAAFYLVPAAWEQRWIAIQQAVDVGMRIRDSWLFEHNSSPDLELHDQVLRLASAILVFTAATASTALAICLVRRKLPRCSRQFWLPLALLIPALFLLQLPLSAPVWNLLPKLQFLQFPWRWMIVLAIPYSTFLAAATPLGTRRTRLWFGLGWAVILLAIVSAGTLIFFQHCDEEDQIHSQRAVFNAGTGVEGTDEYAPVGSDNSLVASGLPDGCLVSDPNQTLGESDSGPDFQSEPVWYPEQGSCDDTFSAQLWQNEHKILPIDSDQEGFVILRLRRYPAWQVTVNGNPDKSQGSREDGLLAVPIPAGPSTIDVRWTTTPDIRWGRWISLAALLGLLALWQLERRVTNRLAATIRLSLNQCP